MGFMQVELTKRADGAVVLRCTRADGSVTWQKQERQGVFFALHDLTHFAVETVLGYRRGFFGLIAEGWEIADTGGKGARGPLPPEALDVERLVSVLDIERAGGAVWTAAEVLEGTGVAVTEAAWGRVREARDELLARWRAWPQGESLRLEFEGTGRTTDA